MISRLVPGTSALCRIVRLIGEGWTGEGCGCALSDSAIPNMIRAVQSTILLNMVPSLNNGNLSYETMKARPPLALAFFASLDHLVGASEQRRGHLEAEHLGGRQIDDEFELGRLLDRNFAWLRTAQNLVNIVRGAPILVREVCSIGHQTSGFDELPVTEHRRQSCAQRPSVDTNPVGSYERVGTHIKRLRAALQRLEGGRDILRSPDFQCGDLEAERACHC